MTTTAVVHYLYYIYTDADYVHYNCRKYCIIARVVSTAACCGTLPVLYTVVMPTTCSIVANTVLLQGLYQLLWYIACIINGCGSGFSIPAVDAHKKTQILCYCCCIKLRPLYIHPVSF